MIVFVLGVISSLVATGIAYAVKTFRARRPKPFPAAVHRRFSFSLLTVSYQEGDPPRKDVTKL